MNAADEALMLLEEIETRTTKLRGIVARLAMVVLDHDTRTTTVRALRLHDGSAGNHDADEPPSKPA